MTNLQGEKAYTAKETAIILGICESTVREYVNRGKLQGRNIDKQWYITGSSIKAFVENRGKRSKREGA